MFFSDVVRSRNGKRSDATLGAKAAAKTAGINWRAFEKGIENRWIVPQAEIHPEAKVKLRRKPILGFELAYLEDIRPIFASSRQGAVVWTHERITACQSVNRRWSKR